MRFRVRKRVDRPLVLQWLCAVSLLTGCLGPAETNDIAPSVQTVGDFQFGEPVVCDSPDPGFDRFINEAASRGFSEPQTSGGAISPPQDTLLGGSFSVEDLDADGDLDVAMFQLTGEPRVLRNDGTGHYTTVPQGWSTDATGLDMVAGQGAIDLNEDGLPDIVSSGPGRMRVSWNLGGLVFSAPERLYAPPEGADAGLHTTMSWGDLDGDGDLDVLLPGLINLGILPSPPGSPGAREPEPGVADLVLRNDSGSFELVVELTPAGVPGGTFVSTLTDRDLDGDLDLFVASEGGHYGAPLSAFYRNDMSEGAQWSFVNDAPDLAADLPMSGMGVATWDFNEDGLFDYCLTDLGPAVCLVSLDGGPYTESATALNLVPEGEEELIFWSLEILDLDNDGAVDAVTSGGPPTPGATGPDGAPIENQPDVIWQGSWVDVGGQESPTFVDRTDELGFGDTADHYGLVAADLSGDGFLDILTMGNEGLPVLWMNQCGDGRWLEVELVGPPANQQGWGARLEASVDGHTQLHELQNIRAFAQGPSRFHIGAGDADVVDSLRIVWPDGEVSEAVDVPVNRAVIVRHSLAP